MDAIRLSQEPDVTDATFATKVLRATQPVLVDFWAPWCGPCRMFSPVIDELAEAYRDKVTIVKLNIDENPEIASRYRVASIPTVLFFRDGEVVDQVVGLVAKKVLITKLEAQLTRE